MPRPWFSIRYCPSESLYWPRRLRRRLSLRMNYARRHCVMSGCDSSENGFPDPKRKWWPRTRLYFLFWVPNSSAVRRLSTALACMDSSGRRNAGPGSILHQHDYHTRQRHSLREITHLKPFKPKKKKKKEPLALQWRGFTLCSLRIRLRIGDSESLHVFSEFHTARFFRLQIWLRMARFWQSKSRGGSSRILIRSATYQPASIRILIRSATYQPASIRILRRSATYQPASIRILIRSATYQPASIRILRRSATYQPASIRILRRSATYQLASIRILRRSATYQPASIRSLGVQLYRLIRAIFSVRILSCILFIICPARNLSNTSATSTFNMKQEWGSFQEQKSLPTNCNPHTNLHWKWAQRTFARIFLPTMADIKFRVKVSAKGL